METFANVPGRAFFAVSVGGSGAQKWYQRIVDESGAKTMKAIGLEDSRVVEFESDRAVSSVLNYWQIVNLFQDLTNAGRVKRLISRLSNLSVFGEIENPNGYSPNVNGDVFDSQHITQRVKDILCSGDSVFGLLGSSY